MAKGSKGKKKPSGRRPTPAKRPAAKRPPAPSGDASTAPAGTAAPGPAGTQAGAAPKLAPPKQGGPGKPTRTERLEAARRARKRKALLTRVAVVATLVVVVGVIALLVAADRREERAERDRLTAGSCTFDTKGDDVSSTQPHVAPASYEVDPPSKGNHDPSPAPAGVYGEAQQVPSDQKLVHSLEHGFIILWHRPDLDDKDLTAVRSVFEGHADDVLMVPRASLKQKVVATSWGRRLLCGEVEPARLGEFVDLYRNKSPEPRS